VPPLTPPNQTSEVGDPPSTQLKQVILSFNLPSRVPQSQKYGRKSGRPSLPKVNIFCWLMVHGKILTTENLKKRGILGRQIPKFVCWEIWLARNQTIFRGKLSTLQRIFAKICGLISEVFSSRSIQLDLTGSLEQKEEDWIAYILGPNPFETIPFNKQRY
jgi:hypothetical protein